VKSVKSVIFHLHYISSKENATNHEGRTREGDENNGDGFSPTPLTPLTAVAILVS
jgi:hypothetical protein